nr:uncharacterized protein LOC107450690 isoform X9 [Parasteatoda tepidariorum]
MASTRKRLTLKEKVDVLNVAENEKLSLRALGQRFRISKNQVSNVLKDREEITKLWITNSNKYSKNVKFRKNGSCEMDRLVHDWLCSMKARNISVNGASLREKAKTVSECLGLQDFKASNGWLAKFKQRHNITKKGGSSLQKSNDSNVLPAGQCSNSTSTSLMSSSDIVIKQEIIETESESSIFDDASFHSSIADGPSEAQFDGQRPSTSYVTCSESSNSNTDYILPGGHNDVVSSAPTQSQISRTVKVEPDVSSNSCGVVSEKNCRNESILPGVSSQIGSSSFSLGSSNHGSSWTNESTQSKVPSHSNPPFRSKDRFDIFGEFVASKLRNLDSKSSAFIQTTFSDLLFKAELGMFSERGEKGFSDAQTDYAGKSPNKNTHGSSEKENVQPGSSSHIENTLQDFSLTQRSPRDDIQHRSPSHRTNQLSPPVANSTSPENALSNEPIQLASHTENPLPPVESVTVSENSSRTSPNQTGVSVLPSGSPVLHTANSWSGTHIQPTIPLHMRPRDDFDVYGEFVASKLRSLDPRSCAFVQTAFADLIFKGELGRFVSEGEHNFFANKTNNLLWNLPSNNPQKNVVSSSEPQTRFNLITPNICADPIPMEIIPNLHFVQK